MMFSFSIFIFASHIHINLITIDDDAAGGMANVCLTFHIFIERCVAFDECALCAAIVLIHFLIYRSALRILWI